MKRIQQKFKTGATFIVALSFSQLSLAQTLGGVIEGDSVQQAQPTQNAAANFRSQPINQNARLLLEIQSLRQELALLRNQVEQQGYQISQMQQSSGQVPSQGQNNVGIGQVDSQFNTTQPIANQGLGEIPASNLPNSELNTGQTVQQGSANSVQFPLLPQDQVPQDQFPQNQASQSQQGQGNQNSQQRPQLVPQNQNAQQPVQVIPVQPQSQVANQAPAQNQVLTPRAQLLEGGDKAIPTNLNELELYNRGIDMLSGQDYRAAASIFSSQLQNFPRGEKAGDGYFWLGETFYILDDLESAAKSYQTLVDRFPSHIRTPKALLKLIGVHQTREDDISARISMSVLQNKYAGTVEANTAKSEFSSLL